MRFRATSTIVWDFDCSSQKEAQELANKHLGSIPNQDGLDDLRILTSLDKLRDKVEKIKLGEFKIEDVLPFVSKTDLKKEYEYNGVKHEVKMNSPKYFTFKQCLSCVSCGLKSTHVFLECHPADKSPHFSFYGEENGNLILMTKDHIYAKAFGGEDRHSNYQTMCLLCNNLKGHSNLKLEDVLQLRKAHDKNKGNITNKKLYLLIEELKAKLEKPWSHSKLSGNNRLAKFKASADIVVTACDINLYLDQDLIHGKSVYDSNDGHKHIGCIRKGTCLEPLVATKEKVMCKLFDDDVFTLHHGLVKIKD